MGASRWTRGSPRSAAPSDFYAQLEPDKIAEHILATSERDIRDLVERTMEREHPQLWHDLPPQVREAVHERVQAQLPDIVREVTDQIGDNIDQLLDIKLMVIRHLEAHPELANRIFLEMGEKELRFIINFGFFFGFVLGIPTIVLVELFRYWWVLPIAGTLVGYATNWLAIWMIFEPVEPRKVGRFTLHGLFLRRQQRGGRGLRERDRRRHRDDRQHRRGAAARAALGPHAPDDRDRHAPGGGPRDGSGALRRAGGSGHARVRRDPRVGGRRGAWTTR